MEDEKVEIFPNEETLFSVKFIKKALQNEKIESVKVEKPATHGMMSQTRRVYVKYSEDESFFPGSFIFKYAGLSDVLGDHGKLNMDGIFYRCEVKFYKFVMGNEDIKKVVPIPKIHYLQANENCSCFIIIMEDLLPVEDRKSTSDGQNQLLQSGSIEEVNEACMAIAPFHATFWKPNEKSREMKSLFDGNGYSAFKDSVYLSSVMEDFSLVFHTQFLAKKSGKKAPKLSKWAAFSEDNLDFLVSAFGESFQKALKTIDEKRGEFGDEFEKKVELLKKFDMEKYARDSYYAMVMTDPITVRHGDFRRDIDWQNVGVGNPLLDVVSLIYQTLDREDVSKCEETILKNYWEIIKITTDVKFSQVKELYCHAFCWEVYKFTLCFPAMYLYKNHPQLSSVYHGLRRICLSVIDGMVRNLGDYFQV